MRSETVHEADASTAQWQWQQLTGNAPTHFLIESALCAGSGRHWNGPKLLTRKLDHRRRRAVAKRPCHNRRPTEGACVCWKKIGERHTPAEDPKSGSTTRQTRIVNARIPPIISTLFQVQAAVSGCSQRNGRQLAEPERGLPGGRGKFFHRHQGRKGR
mgnify:CR=1 FL=1